MMKKVNFQVLQTSGFKMLTTAFLLIAGLAFAACNPNSPDANVSADGTVDPNETAATVNGKAIKLEEVERVLKQQAAGQEATLSPLELAAARLQVLENLIQQEVLFQKAEAENTVPTDEEITAEINKMKTESGRSAEQWQQEMEKAGMTDEALRQSIKEQLAIKKLVDKITGKIEPPKDSEIQAFYQSNPAAFKQGRGARLGAIVIDPRDLGEGDTTKNEMEAQQKAKEVGDRLLRGADFATVAREVSEDPQTRFQGGDWRYFTEAEMKEVFGGGFADFVMNKLENGQIIPQAIPFEGKILIVKLQEKKEQDEEKTLETPGVREDITKLLIESRKQLLSQSYAAVAMNEAKIENFLAQKVVSNPNELSGARPAAPANANTNTTAPTNANTANTNAANTANTNAANSSANKANANK